MKGLKVFHAFLNRNESLSLLELVDKSFTRLAPSYIHGHFDNVMVGDYREMMVSSWKSDSLPLIIFNKLKIKAGLSDQLKWESIHVLDLKNQYVFIMTKYRVELIIILIMIVLVILSLY